MGYTGVNDSAAFWGIGVSVSQQHSGVLGYTGVTSSEAFYEMLGCQ